MTMIVSWGARWGRSSGERVSAAASAALQHRGAQVRGAAGASAGAGGAARGLRPAPCRGAGAPQGRTDSASAQLTLQEASSATHSLCGGRISGKQLQRGSLIRSQPNSAGSSLYRLPAAAWLHVSA